MSWCQILKEYLYSWYTKLIFNSSFNKENKEKCVHPSRTDKYWLDRHPLQPRRGWSPLRVCRGLPLVDKSEFYMKYPFAAHSEAESSAFRGIVPIDGAIFSRSCFDRNFASTSDIYDSCNNLKTLNCVKNMITRGEQS